MYIDYVIEMISSFEKFFFFISRSYKHRNTFSKIYLLILAYYAYKEKKIIDLTKHTDYF